MINTDSDTRITTPFSNRRHRSVPLQAVANSPPPGLMNLKENIATQDPKTGNQSFLVKYWYVGLTAKRYPFERNYVLRIVPLGGVTGGREREIAVGQSVDLLESITSLLVCQLCTSIETVAPVVVSGFRVLLQ